MNDEVSFGYEQVTPEEKTARVGGVFSSVAARYDVMNDAMSGGMHRLWKDRFVRRVKPQPGEEILDMAGGTGDIAFRLEARGARVTVADINQDMLDVGIARAMERGIDSMVWSRQNAEELTYPDRTFDGYTIAFGIRNVTHIDRALAEALDWLLLVLLACAAGAGLFAKRTALHRYLILWLSSAYLVLLSVGFKALVPSSHHADFRFIFPVIVTGSLFLGLALAQFKRRDLILSPIAQLATWTFIGLSFVYFLPKAALITRLSAPKGTVTKQLSEVSAVKAPQTVWDKKGNTIIPDGYELKLNVDPAMDNVLTVEFTLDHNDSYEITLQGTEGERHLVVGPYEKPKFAGLARYTESFDDPLNGVTVVKVRPLAGDSYYSLGHLLLKTDRP